MNLAQLVISVDEAGAATGEAEDLEQAYLAQPIRAMGCDSDPLTE